MSNTFIRYGDFITIKSFFLDKSDQIVNGCLSSKGFFNRNVYFQSIPFITQEEKNLSHMNNYRDFVFQIWPGLSFQAYKELMRAEREKNMIKAALKISSNDPNLQEDLNIVESNLVKLREKLIVEKNFNKRNFEIHLGSNLSYGADIQLMHFDSKMFLSGKIITSEAEKSSFKFELSESYSSGMAFSFEPLYKMRQIGENIQFNDEILIFNKKLKCYLNFSPDKPFLMDRDLSKEKDAKPFQPYYKTMQPKLINPSSQKFEVFLSNYSDIHFKVVLHGRTTKSTSETKQINPICGGDLIRLRHTETRNDLTASLGFEMDNPELHLYSYEGEYENERETVNSIFEIEQLDAEILGDPCIFTTYNENEKNLFRFRLRHFMSGNLLGLGKKGEKNIPMLLKVDDNNENQLVYLKFISTIAKDIEHLKDKGVYQIEFSDKLYMHVENDQFFLLENVIKLDPKEDIFHPLLDKESMLERKQITLTPEISEENAFQIIKIKETEKNLVLRIYSIMNDLNFLRDSFRFQIKDVDFLDYCKKVSFNLQNLIFFVLQIDGEADPFECEGIPDQERQNLMKDMYILDLLVDLVYLPFKNAIYDISNLKDVVPQELLDVFVLSYRLIKFSIEEYRPNELYASQWIGLFMNQSFLADPKVDIRAEPTLTELIDNNRAVLESKIKKENIKNFVDLITLDQKKKYAKLLKALCVCDGEPMLANQSEISKLFFQNAKTRDDLIYKIRESSENHLEIYVYEKWISLVIFNEESKIVDNLSKYDFFLSFIELLADLCFKKNYLAIDELKDIYSLKICYLIISNEKYQLNLRTAFIKLMITLWIEQEAQEIQTINFVRSWNDIDQNNSTHLICTSLDISKFEPLKTFIINYLTTLKNEGFQKAFEFENNLFTLQVLNMLKTMIMLGFLKSREEIKEILPNILFLLNGVNDVTNFEELQIILRRNDKSPLLSSSPTKNLNMVKSFNSNIKRFTSRYYLSEETIILMNCKSVICDILNIILNLRNDLCISLFMNEYKQEFEYLQKIKEGNNEIENSVYNQNQENGIESAARKLLKGLISNTSNKHQEEFKLNLSAPFEWIDKILDNDDSMRIKKNEGFSDVDIIILLFDLTLYKSDDLVNKSFELVYRLFSQKQQLFQTMLTIQVLEDESLLKSFYKLKEIKSRLENNVENSEKWYGINSVNEQIMASKTCQDLEKLISLLDSSVNSANIKNIEIGEEEIVEGEYVSKNENGEEFDMIFQVNKEVQELVKNLDIQNIIIDLLKYDLSTNSEEILDHTGTQIIRLCYKFLAYFVHENTKNQICLEKDIKIFRRHLRSKKNYNAHLFLIELFRNNKKLLFDPYTIEKFIKIFFEIMLSDQSKLKVFMMNSMKLMLKFKDTIIKTNQTKFISVLGLKSFNKSFLFLSEDEIQKFITLSDEYTQSMKNGKILLDIPIDCDFFCQKLMVLAYACEDKNDAAESRCQTFFPLRKILHLMENTEKFWYLRKYILFFLYHVFFDTEKDINESQSTLNKITMVILTDFEKICEQIDDDKNIEIRNFKGSTSLYFVKLDYLFSSIIPCLQIIAKINLISSELVLDFHRKLLDGTVLLGKKIIKLNYRKELSNFIAIISKKKLIMEKLNYEEKYKPLLSMDLINSKKNLKFKKAVTHTDSMIKDEQISKSDMLHARMKDLEKHEKYSNMIEEEFEKLVQHIINIEDETTMAFKGESTISQKTTNNHKMNLKFLSFRELCISILALIDPSKKTLSSELKIVGLKIFRKIIEKENKNKTTPAAEWSTSDYSEYEKKINKRQNELCDFGLVELLGDMIGSDLSLNLKSEAILVAIALLLGGNEKIQERFYRYFTTQDIQNKMLTSLKRMIDEYFARIKKKMELANKQFLENILERQESSDLEVKQDVHENKSANKNKKKNKVNPDNNVPEEEVELLDSKEDDNSNSKEKNDYKSKINVSKIYEDDEEIQTAVKNCTKIFRLLQLFCEGHRLDMQNHLRTQFINKVLSGKSQNFIAHSTYKLGSIIKFVNSQCDELLSQILDFLIESVQGPCALNQFELSKLKIADHIKDLLNNFMRDFDYIKRGFIEAEEKNRINNIVTKSSNLLISMIEGNNNKEILKDLSTCLDYEFMRSILTKEFENFLQNELKLKAPYPGLDHIESMINFTTFEGNIAQAFNMYVLIKTIASNLDKSENEENTQDAEYMIRSDLSEESPLSNLAMKFYDANVKSIELLFQGKLIKIFFIVHPACFNLSRNTRKELMVNVKRESINEKIMGLISSSSSLFNEMVHMTTLKKFPIRFDSARLNFFRDLSTLLAFFLNILMLATFYRKISNASGSLDKVGTQVVEGGESGTDDGDKINILLFIFGCTQVVTSGITVTFWCIIFAKLVIKRKWEELVRTNRKIILDKKMEEEIDKLDFFDVETLDYRMAQYILYVKGPESKYFIKGNKREFGSMFLAFQYYLKCFIMLASDNTLLYMIFYIVVSFLGLLMNPLFYCYHLLDIINRFETLKNVIRSVTRNANQLLLTLFLGLLILYLYSILMFFFLYDAYWNPDINDSTGENMCVTMFQCYLSTVNWGLRMGGGFGDKIVVESFNNNNRGRFYLSVIIELTAFSLINVIFLNIIFGIIIDTFAELRDEKTKMDDDMKNVCFICGLTRYNFEKTGKGFDNHIDMDHRLWNYLYYIFYLNNKDQTEFNGIESEIMEKVEQDDISWFPLMKAIVLGEIEQDSDITEMFTEKSLNLKKKLDETADIYEQKIKDLISLKG